MSDDFLVYQPEAAVNFIDLGLTKLPLEAYPIRVNVQLASKSITGWKKWLPIHGDVKPIPEEWNVPKPGYLVIYAGRPRLCNTSHKPSEWTASWEVGRSGEYKIDHVIISNRDTGENLFAMSNLRWDFPRKKMEANAMIHINLST